MVRQDGRVEALPSKILTHLDPGDAIEIYTTGGGGYGDPLDRDPCAVLEDVIDGRVSIDKRGARLRCGRGLDREGGGSRRDRVAPAVAARGRAPVDRPPGTSAAEMTTSRDASTWDENERGRVTCEGGVAAWSRRHCSSQRALLLATFASSWAQDGTFLVLTRNQPRTIDPAIGADNPTRKVHVGVYEPLIDHKLGTADVANLEGVLAKSWKVSADGLTYTFALRENVKFHDGSTLSAEDVKVSLDRMKKIGLGRSWALDPVKEVRIVNPLTVELVLSRPYPPFILGLPVVFILSADAIKKNQKGDDLAQGWLGQNEAGTGPFRVREFKVGEHIVMEKFDGYWRGWPQKHLSRVILKLVAEPATQKILMDGGQGHWADTISPGDLEAFAERPEFAVTGEPTWGIQFFWMNSKKAPLDDVRVRHAMRAAFPYDQMIRDVMRGKGTLPQGFLPPGLLHACRRPDREDRRRARPEAAGGGRGRRPAPRSPSSTPSVWTSSDKQSSSWRAPCGPSAST